MRGLASPGCKTQNSRMEALKISARVGCHNFVRE